MIEFNQVIEFNSLVQQRCPVSRAVNQVKQLSVKQVQAVVSTKCKRYLRSIDCCRLACTIHSFFAFLSFEFGDAVMR